MSEPLYSSPEPQRAAGTKPDVWRDEIHARLDRYRARRGRRVEGAYSMRFPFPAPGESAATASEDNAGPEPQGASVASEPTAAEFELPAATNPELLNASPTDWQQQLSSDMPDYARDQITAAVQGLIAAEEVQSCATNLEAAATHDTEPSEREIESAQSLKLHAYSDIAEPQAFSLRAEAEPVEPVPAPRPRLKRKVIAFPRHLMAVPESAYQLAEPVLPEQPRILDVPEELEAVQSTPFLDGLQFDRAPESSETVQHAELPIASASIGRRVYAAAVDALAVLAGCAVFAAAAYRIVGVPAAGKSVVAIFATVPALLWFAYQYLFLLYGGATLGMRAAGLELSTFEGHPAVWSKRRARALAFALATASLGMGLLWCFTDVDRLCWHDRMSQTYLVRT